MPTKPDDAAYKQVEELRQAGEAAYSRGDADIAHALYSWAEYHAWEDASPLLDWHKKPAGDELEW